MSDSRSGINRDEGKLRLDLVPPEAIEAIARVAGQACETGKYPERNWELGMLWMKQYASCMRHIMKWMKGEDLDEDTGLPHLEHALWRLAALVTYAKRRIGNDDRPGYPEEPEGEFFDLRKVSDKEPENLAHWDAVIGHNDDVVSPVCGPKTLDEARKLWPEIFVEQQDEGRIDPGPQPAIDFAQRRVDEMAQRRTRPSGYDIQQNPGPLPVPAVIAVACPFGDPDCPICE